MTNNKFNSIITTSIDDLVLQKNIMTRLIPIAKTPFDSNLIRTIQVTMSKHINMLHTIYFNNTNLHYSHSEEIKTHLGSFDDNLKNCLLFSFDALSLYTHLHTLSERKEDKDLFFEIISDQHCITSKISYLL